MEENKQTADLSESIMELEAEERVPVKAKISSLPLGDDDDDVEDSSPEETKTKTTNGERCYIKTKYGDVELVSSVIPVNTLVECGVQVITWLESNYEFKRDYIG